MHIDNCKYHGTVHKTNDSNTHNNVDYMAITSVNFTLINWLVIMVLFYVPDSSYKGYPIVYHIVLSPTRGKTKSTYTMADIVSSQYTKYVTTH